MRQGLDLERFDAELDFCTSVSDKEDEELAHIIKIADTLLAEECDLSSLAGYSDDELLYAAENIGKSIDLLLKKEGLNRKYQEVLEKLVPMKTRRLL